MRALTDVCDALAMQETIAACESAGAAVAFFAHDNAMVELGESLMAHIAARFGRLDLVVNNAGISSPIRGDLLDMKVENFDRVMAVNLRGTLFLSQAAARYMLTQQANAARAIILITSVSAEMASAERADYCMSKAGLSMFAKTLALRLAPENIAVFEVRPGIIATDMTAGVTAKYDADIADGLVPMRRWGTSGDVARCVGALASGALGFATGTIINAGGGLAIPRL